MLLRIQDCVSDDPEMEKWAPLTELAIGALRTAGFTLQDMVVDAQVEEEFTAFSRFACLTQSNEIANALLDYVIALDTLADGLYVAFGVQRSYVIDVLIGEQTKHPPPRFLETSHLTELALHVTKFQEDGVPFEHGSHVARLQYFRLAMMRKEITKLLLLLR